MRLSSSKRVSRRNFRSGMERIWRSAGEIFPRSVAGALVQRRDQRVRVLHRERRDEHGRVLQVGRHAHLGDGDEHAVELRARLAAREDIGQRMAHQLADAELALRGFAGSAGCRSEASSLCLSKQSCRPRPEAEQGVMPKPTGEGLRRRRNWINAAAPHPALRQPPSSHGRRFDASRLKASARSPRRGSTR